MSSPFPFPILQQPPGALASATSTTQQPQAPSPFNFPFLTAPSPSSLPFLQGASPSFAFPTSTGYTPQAAGLISTPANAINLPVPFASIPAPIQNTVPAPKEGDDTSLITNVEEALRLLERLEALGLEIKRLGEDVIRVGADWGSSEGLKSGDTGYTKLEHLQTLSVLYTLAQTSPIGALPVPLSSALPAPPPSSDPPLTLASPTIAELAAWAEGRAGLEFSRREAVKGAAKGVGDVLRASR